MSDLIEENTMDKTILSANETEELSKICKPKYADKSPLDQVCNVLLQVASLLLRKISAEMRKEEK